jgi:lipopolysaccharide export system protein LptA
MKTPLQRQASGFPLPAQSAGLATLLFFAALCLLPGVARAQFQDFSMDNLVSGDANIKTSGSLQFSMDADWKPVKMIAKENVRVVTKDFSLACDTLTYLAADNQATALGSPVHLTQPGLDATCQKLELFPAEGKSILTGNPVIKRDQGPGKEPTTIRGRKITIIQRPDKTFDILIDAGEVGSGKSGDAKPNGKAGTTDGGAVLEFSLDDKLRGLDGVGGVEMPLTATPSPTPVKKPE